MTSWMGIPVLSRRRLLGLAAGVALGPYPVRVAAVADGAGFSLDDGRAVRLAGLEPPRLGPHRPGPLSAEATAALAGLILGRGVGLAETGEDRHGRLRAHVTTAEGVWIQAAMLDAGLARVRTEADACSRAAAMLDHERRARATGLGVWSLPVYRVLDPAAAAHAPDGFMVIEGVVLRVGVAWPEAEGLALDLGPGVVAAIEPPALRRFRAAAFVPDALAGRRIRLRGWLTRDHGLRRLGLTHPEQIEDPP